MRCARTSHSSMHSKSIYLLYHPVSQHGPNTSSADFLPVGEDVSSLGFFLRYPIVAQLKGPNVRAGSVGQGSSTGCGMEKRGSL
jgi:hypothetical protein